MSQSGSATSSNVRLALDVLSFEFVCLDSLELANLYDCVIEDQCDLTRRLPIADWYEERGLLLQSKGVKWQVENEKRPLREATTGSWMYYHCRHNSHSRENYYWIMYRHAYKKINEMNHRRFGTIIKADQWLANKLFR